MRGQYDHGHGSQLVRPFVGWDGSGRAVRSLVGWDGSPMGDGARLRGAGIRPLVHLTLPENGIGEDAEGRHFAPIIFLLEGLCRVNEWLIRRSIRRYEKGEIASPMPPLYMSGVRYKEDAPGEENWKDCVQVLRDLNGDCDRLVAWRVGELWAANIPARPVIKWQQLPKWFCVREMKFPPAMVPEKGISMVHVLVERPDGTIEDPSKNLGMGGAYNNSV
jgi:hypothetical protein